jgi:hypothetical protein
MTAFDRAWAILKNIGQCDSCGEEAVVGELRLSEPGDYGPGSGYSAIDLCRPCWANEMDWRQGRNEDLMYQMQPDVKPEIPDELNDYGAVADFIEGLASFSKPTEESLFPILPFPHMEGPE